MMLWKIQNAGMAMACIVVAIGLILSMIDAAAAAAAGTESAVRRRRRRRTTAAVHMDAWVRGEPGARAAQTKQPPSPSSILRVEDTTITATTSEKIAAAAAMVHDEEEQYLQRMLHSHSLSMSMRMLRSTVDAEDQKQDDVAAADRTAVDTDFYWRRTLQTNSMSMSMNLNLSIVYPPSID